MKVNDILKRVASVLLFIVKALIVLILIVSIIGATVAAVITTEVINNIPKYEGDNFKLDDQSIIYDKNNNVIATVGQKRQSLEYEEIPEVFVHALLATEDSRFFSHDGVDKPRFLKASTQLGQAGGGSTLTMQASKNVYTRPENIKETTREKIERKIQDIYVSMYIIEQKYTKEEIFTFYVNSHYLGNYSYGIEAAAHNYFGKSATELNLAEASFLAGLFQLPNKYNPAKVGGLELAEKRRNTVLDLMVLHEYITEEQADLTKSIPLASYLNVSSSFNQTNTVYTDYINTAIIEVRERTGMDPYTKPMQIYTNMDPVLQEHLYNVKNKPGLFYDEKQEIAATVIDNTNGTIAGVITGRNSNEVGFNYAVALNQPGSTAKAYMDYGPCFEYGNCTSVNENIIDEPYTYTNGTPIKNWNNTHGGKMTLSTAISMSLNIPALKLFQRQSSQQTLDFTRALGLNLDERIDTLGLFEAHAIGGYTGESTITSAGAYSAFARGGVFTPPSAVNRVVINYNSKEPETIELSREGETKRVMKEYTADALNQLLSVNTNGTFGSNNFRGRGVRFAMKTGTSNWDRSLLSSLGISNSTRDNWIAVYSPDYTTVTWIGYDKLNAEYVANGWYFSGRNNPQNYKYKFTSEIALGPHQPRDNKQFPNWGMASTETGGGEIDENGDDDEDGVINSVDLCPETPIGQRVNAEGCAIAIKDADNDGVEDENDNCPAVAGPASNDGCPLPKDTDGDGVIDDNDRCPLTAGIVSNNGCPAPVDSDGDGIADENDQCPNTVGVAANNGCPTPPPVDTDGDGVIDDNDDCPNTAGTVNNKGCPETTGTGSIDITNIVLVENNNSVILNSHTVFLYL